MAQIFEAIDPGEEWELNHLLIHIAKELSAEELEEIKFCLSGEGGIPKRKLSQMNSALELFTFLKETRRMSNDNTLFLQTILWHLKREALYEKAVKWAKNLGNSLYFYKPDKEEQVNGYKHVQFHVRGRSKDFMRSNLEALRANVSRLLMIPPECVLVCGIEESNSLVVTFLIPEQTEELLKDIFRECSDSFSHLGVDNIRFDIWNSPENFELEEKTDAFPDEAAQVDARYTLEMGQKMEDEEKMRKRTVDERPSLGNEIDDEEHSYQRDTVKKPKIEFPKEDAESTGGTATMETTQLETKVKPTDEHLAADRTVQEITSAGYHLRGVKCATPKYNISWETCEKHPGHEGFIPLHAFSSQHLPPKFQGDEIFDYIKCWADLTVRLRVYGRSFKLGTAYINSVVRLDKDCICRDCKMNGYKDRKWWCINLNGAAYYVVDNWEAENSKVDFFLDTVDHLKNREMKTLHGVKKMGSTGAEDVCLMMCATHDDDLGIRLQRTWEQAIQLLSKFGSKTTVGCEQASSKVLVCISHPHGAPKQVTVGELIQQEDFKNEVPEDVPPGSMLGKNFGVIDQRLKYTTKTCQGSSGAILICLDDLVSEDISARFSSSCIHIGSVFEFNRGLCRRVVSLERYLSFTMQKNLVKSMLGANRSSHAEPDEKSEMVRPKLVKD